MRRSHLGINSIVLTALMFLTGGCGPAAAPSVSTAGQAEKPAVKKILNLADSYEPKAIIETFVEGHQTSGNNVKALVHDTLLGTPAFQVDEPLLAA